MTEDKRAGHEWAVLPRFPLPVAKAGFHAPARVTRRGSRPIETSRPYFQVMALTCALALPSIRCKIAGLCPVRTILDLHLYHGSLITWRDRNTRLLSWPEVDQDKASLIIPGGTAQDSRSPAVAAFLRAATAVASAAQSDVQTNAQADAQTSQRAMM